MERLIEGIQDFEKIRVLRNGLKADKAAKLDAQLAKFIDIDWDKVTDAEITSLVGESKALLRRLEK